LGTLVGNTREILGVLQAQETKGQARTISAPSIIATDSVPAVMNVGVDVPTLTSQAVVGGVESNGSNVFSNTVSSESSGVTVNILARVSPSGVVTMVIDQDVSQAQPTTSSGIDSPSFQRRSIQTQITVQDGDTIAMGGAITESKTSSTTGVPWLIRIPVLGGLFGSKSTDTNQLVDATEEIRDSLHHLQKMIKDQQQ
jgi:general secretion pathway protein D